MLTKNGEPVFSNDEWLAFFALICWECKALDEKTLIVVKEIFADREDIEEEWEDLAEKRLKEIEKLIKNEIWTYYNYHSIILLG